MTILRLLVIALACGCVRSQGTQADVRGLVWVGHVYSGGAQCLEHIGYHPPDTRTVLRQVRVTVHATAKEGMPVCEACDCPGYSQMHYALIAASDVQRAARAGYRLRTPPSYLLPDSLKPRPPD